MPVLQDRVQETTTTGGTGTLTLAGAVTGYRSFNSAFTLGDITYYTIDNGSGEWEIGVGTVGSGTLSRNSVLESSNANALVNFSAGTKRVFCSAPTKVLLPNETGNSGKVLTTDGTDPSWTSTLNGITLGNLTPGSGAFTTLSASSTVSGTGFSTYLASPPAIGGTTPAAGNFTTLGATGNVTLGDASGDTLTINAGTTTFAQGTANGVLYLNGSKVATSNSALTFNGTLLNLSLATAKLQLTSTTGTNAAYQTFSNTGGNFYVGLDNSAGTDFGGAYAGVIWNGGAYPILFGVSNTERARITSKGLLVDYTSDSGLSGTGNAIFSGNLGIGTSSPAYKLDIGNATANSTQMAGTTSGVYIYGIGRNDTNGAEIDSYDAITFRTGSTSGARTGSQKMKLDQSGNLGLGVTPSGWAAGSALQMGSTVFSNYSYSKNGIAQNAYYDGTSWRYFGTQAAALYQSDTGAHKFYTAASGTAGTAFTFTQAMTLDASGNLIVGHTSATDGYAHTLFVGAGSYQAIGHSSSASGTKYAAFLYDTAQIGSITQSGTTQVNFNGNSVPPSDIRLKENITDAPSAISVITGMKIRSFDWINGGHQSFGWIAQELQENYPEFVTVGTDESKTLGINQSAIVPLLAAAIKELHAEIEQLKQKVNA